MRQILECKPLHNLNHIPSFHWYERDRLIGINNKRVLEFLNVFENLVAMGRILFASESLISSRRNNCLRQLNDKKKKNEEEMRAGS
jgi:hypothetical protein